ncbi:NAD(P)H:quinone oxidoreductase [Oceanicella actignis]|uniref:NAD(P)H dehydrogenase (quinone) n=1 Tax=Oceanicella actignis TaxID=1189325 RepID=A0A1M7U4Z0_9RHOB|nr:NAD(P)H:quinone oxidoreductase [Oceanicella actignis]RMG59622.1 MAG: NAD(P)H:quinone oxidoreductase [Gammaproteobacteria bacterium]SET89176.1 NAD(P)H dehydrogenase (quinone) [Oceanicella actignis]SHN78048.1 NAD(P)H dehydrogenase (quinone) [Oceanicella actignis]
MTRVLVLYYSSYGHVRSLARAEAEGASSVPGTRVDIRRVPETVPDEVRQSAGFIADDTPVAAPADLEAYDAIIFGTPTRFGLMAGQMKTFLDQAGGLWARNALEGKVGAVFTSTGTQHGGHEATLLSTHVPLLHLGMVVVGLPYSFSGLTAGNEITGCAPYGAGTIAGADGSRAPTTAEMDGARYQGAHVARIAARLAGVDLRREVA